MALYFQNVSSRGVGGGGDFSLILGWKGIFSADIRTKWDWKISLALLLIIKNVIVFLMFHVSRLFQLLVSHFIKYCFGTQRMNLTLQQGYCSQVTPRSQLRLSTI